MPLPMVPAVKPKIRLIYFDSKGLAEVARLILAQAGVEYEDVRITQEEWPKLKPSKINNLVNVNL